MILMFLPEARSGHDRYWLSLLKLTQFDWCAAGDNPTCFNILEIRE